MIDAHCHLTDQLYTDSDRATELQRCRKAGVTAVINNGAGVESSRWAVKLAKKYPEVYATVGIHPEDSGDVDETKLRKLLKQPKVVAVGECGLDYRPETSAREKLFQKELLKLNLKLAEETSLPLVVHCRSAFADIFEVIDYPKVQMHCFTGDLEQMLECVQRGWYISLGGILTFKKSDGLRKIAQQVPEDKLLVETDAPYLTPEPVRGSRNSPANVKIVAEVLADLRGVSLAEIDRITTRNTQTLFRL